MSFVFFFFFSSRRRHTRYIGDWSSDVCSSDLVEQLGRAVREQGGAAGALTVPDTIQEVRLGRIGRPAPEDQRLLGIAALLGKDVPFSIVQAVAGAGARRLGDASGRPQPPVLHS